MYFLLFLDDVMLMIYLDDGGWKRICATRKKMFIVYTLSVRRAGPVSGDSCRGSSLDEQPPAFSE